LYNEKIRARIQQDGNVVPDEVQLVSMFTDGTRFQICKPEGPDFVQREFYYGKDSVHCLGGFK
jgi:hypothetical protein